MATVLKRPMFRMGGPSSDGVGILSGLKRHGFADTANETVGMQAEEITPKLGTTSTTLIALIDRIRMLDNDLIRLRTKVRTLKKKKN